MRWTALAAILLAAAPAWAQPGVDDHMLSGAQLFRDERYPEALVEFRAAERSAGGDPGAAWYVAATLVKLKRAEEALLEFSRAEATAARDRDALLDYYHALACYEARLYTCADRLLAAVGEGAGPRIAAQAQQIRGALTDILRAPPSVAALDWYHAQGQAAAKAERWPLAIAYYQEALALSDGRADHHRRAEAQAALDRARKAASTVRRRP